MEEASNFELNDNVESPLPGFVVLKRILEHKSNNLEKIEFIETIQPDYELCVNLLRLQRRRFKRINKHRRKFHSVPSSPPDPTFSSIPVRKKINVETDNNLALFQTRRNNFKNELFKYGFFDLKMVIELSDENKEYLISLIFSNKLPYCIAMFEYLQFLKYLQKEIFPTHKAMQVEISKWFGSDINGRAVRGNISSLYEKDIAKPRYTAYQYKEQVKRDYLGLK